MFTIDYLSTRLLWKFSLILLNHLFLPSRTVSKFQAFTESPHPKKFDKLGRLASVRTNYQDNQRGKYDYRRFSGSSTSERTLAGKQNRASRQESASAL